MGRILLKGLGVPEFFLKTPTPKVHTGKSIFRLGADGSKQAFERQPVFAFLYHQTHKGSSVYLEAGSFKLILSANT